MSNETKKALLNESTTKRFWKLAGLKPIHEKAYVFEEEEEVDEGMRPKKEDEKDDVDEGMRPAKEDDKEDVDEARGKSEPVGGTLPDGKGFGGVYTHKSDDEASEKVGDATVTPVKVRKMNEEDLEEDMEVAEMGIPAAEDDMGAEINARRTRHGR